VADVPGEAVPVRANRERLVSAINHAVRNAQDACERDGEVRIELAAQGEECAVTISDNGEGMDAGFVRDRLFRPFDSTKGAEGMGIGAYQVRETVRAAGGDVEVTSAPGEGTTFRLRMPLGRKDSS
jgi:signal transduction histidine kinase